MSDKKHFLDKPILRYFFWFIVYPYNLKQWLKNGASKMTDRELLKLVAKTAGKTAPLSIYADGTHLLDTDGTEWNPLKDDGDALRLAYAIGAEISIHHGWVILDNDAVQFRYDFLNLREMRRGIVLAAAGLQAAQEPAIADRWANIDSPNIVKNAACSWDCNTPSDDSELDDGVVTPELVRLFKNNRLPDTPSNLLAQIEDILRGIDQTESESENGWWETSTGAAFGEEKLKAIRALFDIPTKEA